MKTVFVTLYDPQKYMRPSLATSALGKKTIDIKYINCLSGISNSKIMPIRKLSRFQKMYSAFNIRSISGAIILNPVPLGKVVKLTHKPYVVDFMDINLTEDLDLIKQEKDILEKSKGVIFWSKSFRDLLLRKLDIDEQTYIPAGVDLDYFEKSLFDFPLIESDQEKIITYFGYTWRVNGREVQGVYDLVKAVGQVQKKIANVRLVLSGIVPDEELIRVVKKASIKKITYLPPVSYGSSDFLTRLKMSDVLVLPTTCHPTVFYAEQHKLFIYMASKRPIVATATQGTKAVLDDTMATFARPEDPESLAIAIVKILSDEKLALKTANSAFNCLVDKYTWTKLAPEYSDFITRCLS